MLGFDAVAVGGGNTRTMLAIWRDWGLDAVLAKACAQGIVLGGSSAGSICWFDQGITDSIAGALTSLRCLGLVGGSNCPHYDSETDRRPAYRGMVASGEVADGYAADDGVGLHFVDGVFHRAIANRPLIRARFVARLLDETYQRLDEHPDSVASVLDCLAEVLAHMDRSGREPSGSLDDELHSFEQLATATVAAGWNLQTAGVESFAGLEGVVMASGALVVVLDRLASAVATTDAVRIHLVPDRDANDLVVTVSVSDAVLDRITSSALDFKPIDGRSRALTGRGVVTRVEPQTLVVRLPYVPAAKPASSAST